MKFLTLLTLFLSLSSTSNAQILEKIKSLCEERAIAWTGTVSDKQTRYKGNMSIEDVTELSQNKIKVVGYYDIYTTNCGLGRTKFECEIKIILDGMEIQSFCRLWYSLCVWGSPVSKKDKWYCYPN